MDWLIYKSNWKRRNLILVFWRKFLWWFFQFDGTFRIVRDKRQLFACGKIKQWRAVRLFSEQACWMQMQGIIYASINQKCKKWSPPLFCAYRDSALCNVLICSVGTPTAKLYLWTRYGWLILIFYFSFAEMRLLSSKGKSRACLKSHEPLWSHDFCCFQSTG